MKELLDFILAGITGSKDYTIEEVEEEGGRVNLEVKADPSIMGLIIGKGGNTIKAITTILRVNGRINEKLVNVNVRETGA